MRLAILNGPNLNLVGVREPEVYGHVSLDDYLAGDFGEGLTLDVFQSNSEGALIDRLHVLGFGDSPPDGVIVNFGGLSHTSIALADALRAIPQDVVEVHISNIYAREGFRQNSLTAAACVGVITGLGLEGYRLAVDYFRKRATR